MMKIFVGAVFNYTFCTNKRKRKATEMKNFHIWKQTGKPNNRFPHMNQALIQTSI
jgi:hypothetical protein